MVIEFINTATYAEAILDAGGGGRVVPGQAALLDSTNAAQRQKRPAHKGWCGIGGIAALRWRGKPARAVRRQRALHYPQWRSHIRYRIYEFDYLAFPDAPTDRREEEVLEL